MVAKSVRTRPRRTPSPERSISSSRSTKETGGIIRKVASGWVRKKQPRSNGVSGSDGRKSRGALRLESRPPGTLSVRAKSPNRRKALSQQHRTALEVREIKAAAARRAGREARASLAAESTVFVNEASFASVDGSVIFKGIQRGRSHDRTSQSHPATAPFSIGGKKSRTHDRMNHSFSLSNPFSTKKRSSSYKGVTRSRAQDRMSNSFSLSQSFSLTIPFSKGGKNTPSIVTEVPRGSTQDRMSHSFCLSQSFSLNTPFSKGGKKTPRKSIMADATSSNNQGGRQVKIIMGKDSKVKGRKRGGEMLLMPAASVGDASFVSGSSKAGTSTASGGGSSVSEVGGGKDNIDVHSKAGTITACGGGSSVSEAGGGEDNFDVRSKIGTILASGGGSSASTLLMATELAKSESSSGKEKVDVLKLLEDGDPHVEENDAIFSVGEEDPSEESASSSGEAEHVESEESASSSSEIEKVESEESASSSGEVEDVELKKVDVEDRSVCTSVISSASTPKTCNGKPRPKKLKFNLSIVCSSDDNWDDISHDMSEPNDQAKAMAEESEQRQEQPSQRLDGESASGDDLIQARRDALDALMVALAEESPEDDVQDDMRSFVSFLRHQTACSNDAPFPRDVPGGVKRDRSAPPTFMGLSKGDVGDMLQSAYQHLAPPSGMAVCAGDVVATASSTLEADNMKEKSDGGGSEEELVAGGYGNRGLFEGTEEAEEVKEESGSGNLEGSEAAESDGEKKENPGSGSSEGTAAGRAEEVKEASGSESLKGLAAAESVEAKKESSRGGSSAAGEEDNEKSGFRENMVEGEEPVIEKLGSWGGGVAAAAMALARDRSGSMILSSLTPSFPQKLDEWSYDSFANAVRDFDRYALSTLSFGDRDPTTDALERVKEEERREGPPGSEEGEGRTTDAPCTNVERVEMQEGTRLPTSEETAKTKKIMPLFLPVLSGVEAVDLNALGINRSSRNE